MDANKRRELRGEEILDFYASKFGDLYDNQANLTDLLADLMHLTTWRCDLSLDFEKSLWMAKNHFEEEVLNE